jgi:hypothetical protein
LYSEKSMATIVSSNLSGNIEARGVNNGAAILFFENKSLLGSVEEPCQSTLESTPCKKHPNKNNYVEVDFAYSTVDRKYMRVQEQQLTDFKSFVQQHFSGPFIRRNIVWSVEDKILFPKLKKGENFTTRRTMRLKVVYIRWSRTIDLKVGEEA